MHLHRALGFYTWTKVPCVIERFEIRDHPRADKPFSVDLVYHYEWQGRSMTGTQLRADNVSDSPEYEGYSELQRTLLNQADGLPMYCRVNPFDPSMSALLPGVFHEGAIFFLAAGLAFAAILCGLLHAKWRHYDPANRPVIILPFFLLFSLVGMTITLSPVPGLVRYFQAKHWEPVTASVIWSRVGANSGPKHTTYYPDVFYRYQFQGVNYQSNRYGPFGQISEGRDGSRGIAKAHPAGSACVCFVNPAKPWQAVIDQGFSWAIVFALFGVPFLVIAKPWQAVIDQGFSWAIVFALFGVPFLVIGLWGTYHILWATGVIGRDAPRGLRRDDPRVRHHELVSIPGRRR